MMAINIIKGKTDAVQSYIRSQSTSQRKYKGYRILNYITELVGFHELHNNNLIVAKKCFEGIYDDVGDWKSLLLAELADKQGDNAGAKVLRAQALELIEKGSDQELWVFSMFTKALVAGYLAKEGNTERARCLIDPLVNYATQHLSLRVVRFKYLAGMVELADENFDKAAEYFHQNIDDCTLLAELCFRAYSYRALGEIAVVKRDFETADKHFETTTELCRTMGLPTERLYFDYTCYIPSENFRGWRSYQEGQTYHVQGGS